MQPVLERSSIDNPLTFDVGLIQLSFIPVSSPNIYMQYFSQIAQKFCTLVLFIIIIIILFLLLLLLLISLLAIVIYKFI